MPRDRATTGQDLGREADLLLEEMEEALGAAMFIQEEYSNGDGREAISNMPLRLRKLLSRALRMRRMLAPSRGIFPAIPRGKKPATVLRCRHGREVSVVIVYWDDGPEFLARDGSPTSSEIGERFVAVEGCPRCKLARAK